ncbi:hypothetical protein AB2L28_20035 [Kineococcus sp. TBRC 1896]|uniref:Phytanoyl-CoA dioxygenase PhyH n=1 Tax=Kineococcus mangrovi TaxID=1660183 RepID=A0ABV4I778_9ACTN
MRLPLGPRRRARLTPQAHRLLADLRRDGIAAVDLAALLGAAADELLAEVLSRTDDLIADQSADIVRRRRLLVGDPEQRSTTPRDVDLLGSRPPVDPEDPYARFLRHPLVRGVAAAHCRRDVRIWDMNGVLTLAGAPVADGGWTRTDDGPGLQVQLLLTDVDDGVGPLSYVRTSHRHRRRLDRAHVGDRDVERVFGPGGTTTATGRAGTVVFTDPRGLHRTARPTARDRLVLQGRFSPRSGRERAVLLPAEEVPRSALADFALA